jgi:ribonuclease H2 subunit A
MLRHPPTNLNVQSQNATIQLIQHVLSAGLSVSKIFVDALGPSPQYQAYLSNIFPGINITVQPKADSKWKIVGAASVAAKVTRDGWIENWAFAEAAKDGRPPIGTSSGSRTENPEADADGWDRKMGSGYPSDPNTKAWLKRNIERTFGFPSVVRFSWGTVKNILDEKEYDVQWYVWQFVHALYSVAIYTDSHELASLIGLTKLRLV